MKSKIISAASQNMTFSRRAIFLGGVQGAFGLTLAARMAYISVAENERYRSLSESNRVNLTLIPPRRGWLIDRNGKPIANNRTDFRVDVIPDRMKDKAATVAKLADLLKLNADEVARINEDLEKSNGFQPVQIASGLEWSRFAAVSVRLPDLPGVSPQQGFSRYYPTGAAVGHLVGYVGIASAEEYKANKDPILITPGFKIGKDGLEKIFEEDLRGGPGAKRVEVTARGKIVRELTTRPDTPGKPVQLTIDNELQHYAARRLGTQSGSAVVMDCHTGEILAMTSMPAFDPNSFSDGISHAEYGMLSSDDHVPLRDKSLRGLFPPGSTVKPMVGLAFLEAGLSPDESVICRGALRVGNRPFHCWKRGGHGRVDMAKGIYQSCDVYFYHFAQKIGMERIAAMARKLGLGQKFPLPMSNQSYGTVPDPDWKQKKYDSKWQAYDTVNSTIGQGYMLTNPLQLAVMTARIASNKLIMPRIILGEKQETPAPLGIAEDHIQYIQDAMNQVVNGAGTAGRARLPIPGVQLAGKTGTAQVVDLSVGRGGNDVPWKYRDHGLFVSFAPYDNPRYACSVVIQHGGGSGAAYPVARDIMTFLFDKDKANSVLESYENGWGGDIETRMASKMASYQTKKEAEKREAARLKATEAGTSEAG